MYNLARLHNEVRNGLMKSLFLLPYICLQVRPQILLSLMAKTITQLPRKRASLQSLLDEKYAQHSTTDFIADDPISIPHSYTDPRDIEITAFWVSMLSWGQRVTIINKSKELFGLMGESPYDFIVNHSEDDRAAFLDFKHRTFQATDTLYFLEFLQQHYRAHDSMQDLFMHRGRVSLGHFHDRFFSIDDAPQRTRKHVATPIRKSTCKRLCMFLRWMVRPDHEGIDFGLWESIDPSLLYIPLDVHVHRVAIQLGLVRRKQRDWQTVDLLTRQLRKYDQADPVKYDYALFGMGVNGEV